MQEAANWKKLNVFSKKKKITIEENFFYQEHDLSSQSDQLCNY